MRLILFFPLLCLMLRTLLTVHDLSFVRVPEAASPDLKAYLDQGGSSFGQTGKSYSGRF